MLIGVLMVAPLALADGLIDNADFEGTDGWTLPADAHWSLADDDGHSGKQCVRFSSEEETTGEPVTVGISCEPNTEYVLAAWMKSDGVLRPAIRLTAPELGRNDALRIGFDGPDGKWVGVTGRFNSGKVKALTVLIFADMRHLQGKAAPAGTSAVDDVQIWPATQAPADITVPGGIMRTPPGENVAIDKAYTLSPRPNYSYSTDQGDATQLTDGIYSVGYFWVQKSTVGWSKRAPEITIDLGEVVPIAGLSFNTAAGVAGVAWPVAISIFVSDDAKEWWPAGDLVALSSAGGVPAPVGYSVHRYWTDRINTYGRWVKLMIAAGGPYTFCDEIEVYRGPDELLAAAREGEATTNPREVFLGTVVDAGVRYAVTVDMAEVRKAVEQADIQQPRKDKLIEKLDAAEEDAAAASGFGTSQAATVPLNASHADMLAIRSELWRAQKLPRLSVWQNCRWDPLGADDTPPEDAGKPALNITLMGNEVRSEAINITSAADDPVHLSITCHGLRGGRAPRYTTLAAVAWTAVRGGRLIASALPEAQRSREGWQVTVTPGLTQQLWFMVDSSTLPPGSYEGTVDIAAGDVQVASIPVHIRVSEIAMPDELTLILGGWDYTNTFTYGVTPDNREAVVKFLQSYHINGPWATTGVLPFGKHDAEGNMTETPDTSRMDEWLARWPGAKRYYVFNNFRTPVADTPAAKRRVAEWIHFWADYFRERGLEPSQLALHIFDEAHALESDAVIISWAEVLQEAEPQVVLWSDPTWKDPRKMTPEYPALMDVLCPNRPMWISNRAVFEQYYADQREAGRTLSFYSCSGPVRHLDPYSYHRLQAWDCFRVGAVESFFWAMGDTGGASSWNEFAAERTGYSPQFIGATDCTTSKHMEAIRESAYDYEYLIMLRDAVGAAEQAGRDDAILQKARALLAEGPLRVLTAEDVDRWGWLDDKDRSIADQVRVELIEALEALQQ